MKKPQSNYYVFTKQGYDRMYYGVAGREINLNDATLFLTLDEAERHLQKLEEKLNHETVRT
jgi:hypothetical protein